MMWSVAFGPADTKVPSHNHVIAKQARWRTKGALLAFHMRS